MKRTLFLACLGVSGLAGCSDDAPASPDAAPHDAPGEVPDAGPDAAPLPPATGVDLLFVVDDSGSMAEEQQALAQDYFGPFLTALETALGGRPDLHIGVISTNMGAGPYTITNCTGGGDQGALQVGGFDGCPALDGSYISDVSDGAGGRTVNYTGTIGEVFSCQAQLGTTGCGFEQPLASLAASLTNLGNAGFFRDDAVLGIVFLGDEDDCSADDPAIFDPDPALNDPSSPLGPLHSFRCFEFGVVCTPDEPRQVGAKTGCTVRTGSYLTDPAEVAAAVHAFRPPGRVAVATIIGDAEPVAVEMDPDVPDRWTLVPSCQTLDGRAYPGIRLRAFAAELEGASSTGSICGSFDGPLAALASEIAAMLQ
jgi:hypothetical protein